jgi:GNAT superfamily N-acetyltransferase
MKLRLMTKIDLIQVMSIQQKCYREVPLESTASLSSKIDLFPRGCYVIASNRELLGYLICHPWVKDETPSLDTILKVLPQNANLLYVHDLAILPTEQGKGLATVLVDKIFQIARSLGFNDLSLIAVQRSENFWRNKGFKTPLVISEKLSATTRQYNKNAVYMTYLEVI